MQEPRVAHGAAESSDARALLNSERERSRELEARVADLERSRDQLQTYAEDLNRTYAELRRWSASLNTLHEASTGISSALDEELVLGRVVASLGRLVVHESAHIYLADEAGLLRSRAVMGSVPAAELSDRQEWSERQLPFYLMRVVERDDGMAKALAIVLEHATLIVPLRARGRGLGLLALFRDSSNPFAPNEARLVELMAAVASAAIENARLYQQTERLATVDPLTDLYNYRYFHQALALEVARARRHEYPLGVLMADLDHFKLINDRFGHPKGDEVLREVARAATAQLRRTDVLARLGGEEFGVLLPGASAAALAFVGEKLRLAVDQLRLPTGSGTPPIQVTMSIGGVTLPAGRAEPGLLVDIADRALFRAKQAGRNRVEVDNAEEER